MVIGASMLVEICHVTNATNAGLGREPEGEVCMNIPSIAGDSSDTVLPSMEPTKLKDYRVLNEGNPMDSKLRAPRRSGRDGE